MTDLDRLEMLKTSCDTLIGVYATAVDKRRIIINQLLIMQDQDNITLRACKKQYDDYEAEITRLKNTVYLSKD